MTSDRVISHAPPFNTMSKERANWFDSKWDSDWLNPIAMSSVKRAVEKRAKNVVINGHDFHITYGHMINEKGLTEPYECIKLKRKDGVMAPFGYISIRKILRFNFEEGLK